MKEYIVVLRIKSDKYIHQVLNEVVDTISDLGNTAEIENIGISTRGDVELPED